MSMIASIFMPFLKDLRPPDENRLLLFVNTLNLASLEYSKDETELVVF